MSPTIILETHRFINSSCQQLVVVSLLPSTNLRLGKDMWQKKKKKKITSLAKEQESSTTETKLPWQHGNQPKNALFTSI